MSTEDTSFHTEEYKAIRQEIELRLKEGSTTAQNAIIASAAAIAWLATSGQQSSGSVLYGLAWWIPLVLCGLAALRSASLYRQIRLLGRYIGKIEAKFANAQIGGWEHFVSKDRASLKGNAIDVISTFYWLVLILTALAVGILS